MMATLRIQLFGKFCVQRNERILNGFEARKIQELFCYLLLHRDHSLSRENLASVLWPETTTVQSKKNLRQALWQLQTALGSHNEPNNDRLLLADTDWVQLNSQADLWLDVAEFELVYNSVQKTKGQEIDSTTAHLLENTVQFYQGPLLEGWFQDWCLLERERLQSMYLALLDKLMSFCEAQYDFETGLLYGMRIMCYDRARERTHRRMMRLYYLLGDRAEALRQYERCATALDEELGISPSKSTQSLFRQIQADQLDDSSPSTSDTPPEVPAPPLLEILGRLTRVDRSLKELQDQVQQSIQMVETALHKK